MTKIKVIIKRPDEQYGHMTHISNTLENLQHTVDGYIEVVPLRSDLVMICNEEGKIDELDYNFTLKGDDIVGTVIICGTNEDEFADVPISLLEWKEILRGGFEDEQI